MLRFIGLPSPTDAAAEIGQSVALDGSILVNLLNVRIELTTRLDFARLIKL